MCRPQKEPSESRPEKEGSESRPAETMVAFVYLVEEFRIVLHLGDVDFIQVGGLFTPIRVDTKLKEPSLHSWLTPGSS